MRLEWTRAVAILSLTLLTVACGSPPQPEIDAANAALTKARGSQAAQYASGAMTAAEQSKEALDAELAAQEQKWVRSYDRARELAVATTTAAERSACRRSSTTSSNTWRQHSAPAVARDEPAGRPSGRGPR